MKKSEFTHIDLKGVPEMSANCLGLMVDFIEANKYSSYLEYGSGNSTLYFLKRAVANELPLKKILAVECSSDFFDRMNEHIEANFKVRKKEVVKQPRKKLDKNKLKERESYFIIDHSFVNPNFEGCRAAGGPNKLFRSLLGIANLERWLRGRLAYLRMFLVPVPETTKVAYELENGVRFEYVLTPVPLSHFVNDGTYNRFHEYVEAAASDKFDVAFIDGRARVSCVKKVLSDGNMNPGGTIFHHDCYLENYWEGLNLLDTGRRLLVDGENKKIDGAVLRDRTNPEQFHIVLNKYGSDGKIKSVNDREMCVYPVDERTIIPVK
jgi:hypothetical protein